MGTEAIGGSGGIHYVANASDKKKANNMDLNAETFMTLLIAQMQYQDPLEPQSNTDFVAQLAQLTSLEQMQTMNSSLTTSQAMGFVGKEIYAEILNSETGVTEAYAGIVESVIMQSGSVYVVTDGNAIPVENVLMVSDVPAVQTPQIPQTPQQPTLPEDAVNPEVQPEPGDTAETPEEPEEPGTDAAEGV